MDVRAHLHPLLHNMINIYTTLSLASPVSNSVLFLHPISLTITHFSAPCLFQYKGIQLYLHIIVRLQGQEEIATLQWGALVGKLRQQDIMSNRQIGPIASPVGVPHIVPQHIMVNDSFPSHSHPPKKRRKKGNICT